MNDLYAGIGMETVSLSMRPHKYEYRGPLNPKYTFLALLFKIWPATRTAL